MSISCPHRSDLNGQSVCGVVADFLDRPLTECHTNDSACAHCLQCGVAPQVPNLVVASMAIGVAYRANDPVYIKQTKARFLPFLDKAPSPVTTCVLRGPEIRKVACKPCQADSLVPVMVPVFRCPKHGECTLHSTGTFPKIKACANDCRERLEKYVELDAKMPPAAVLAEIAEKRKP